MVCGVIEQKRKKRKNKKLRGMDNRVMIARGRGGKWRRVQGGSVMREGDLTRGGEHTVQSTDDVL